VISKITTIVIALMTVVVSTAGCAQWNSTRSTTLVERIQVSFKLDPRLLGPTYGGERWVSPATYGPILSAGKTYTMEVQAVAFDRNGRSLTTNIEWTPDNPEMINISPNQGGQVTITIQNAGQSRIQITAQDFSKTLLVKAEYVNNAVRVEISQEADTE